MDSIFEEDTVEVGGEIEAYCPSPRCKADTTHTIISTYEDEVRRVQCVVCGEVHAYRKPRGDGVDEASEGASKKSSSRQLTWDDALARTSDNDLDNCRPFTIRDTYEEGDVVHHPKFDIGFVTELLPDNKLKMIFRDGSARVLIHNQSSRAAQMPDISEIPVPREAKKKKRKKAEAPAAPVPARNKAEVEAAVARARNAAQMRINDTQKTQDERNKKLKAEAKAAKGKAPAPAAKAPPAAAAKGKAPAPVAAAAAKKPAAAAKTAKKPAAAAKPAASTKASAAAKPAAKKPAPAAKKPAAKPAKKPVAAKKPAKKPAGKKKK
jgi:hypothetical protein